MVLSLQCLSSTVHQSCLQQLRHIQDRSDKARQVIELRSKKVWSFAALGQGLRQLRPKLKTFQLHCRKLLQLLPAYPKQSLLQLWRVLMVQGLKWSRLSQLNTPKGAMGLDLKRTPNYSSANNEVFKIYRESESYFILLITNEFIKFYYP